MVSYCINLNPPEPMTCKPVVIQKPLYKCWLMDNYYMFFIDKGINYDSINTLLGNHPSYNPSDLLKHLSNNGFIETSCLQLSLVDSQVEPGRIYSELYEKYLQEIQPLLKEVNKERDINQRVAVRQRYNMGYIGCGCSGGTYKPPIVIPPPPFPIEHKSQCICIEYKNKTNHFTSNISLSNLLVENVLRNKRITSIKELLFYLQPLLIEPSIIGVINGVLK